jgi:small GTP-binding protein
MIAGVSMASEYAKLKQEVLSCIEETLAVKNVRSAPCEELRHKILMNTFNLVVVGQFKRGKTSIINALLGADILPVSVVPLTSIVTIITWGETLRTSAHYENGHTEEIATENLADYVTEKGNPRNVKDVREVVVTYPSPYLKDGVRLIDTPGVGSVYEHNTDTAYRYLPKSDAALFILSVDQPMSKAELDFLKDVQEYSGKIFFLLNKADYLRVDEISEATAFSTNVLQNALNTEVKIFPVSAKLALEGKISGADDMIEKSLLPPFVRALDAFLMHEKGNILVLSVANNLLRIISQAGFVTELELKSLEAPLDDLKAKVALFEKKKQELLLWEKDFDILLDSEINRIIATILDADLEQFKKDLLSRARKRMEETFYQYRNLPLKELHTMLEQQAINDVRQSCNVWRAAEDEKLEKAFQHSCRRFIVDMNAAVDELMKFSSELFSVPFHAVKAETVWSAESGFYYKFRDEPVGLEIVASTLAFILPKFIGDKLVLKKTKEFLRTLIDMQSGRLHYDFAERLDKTKRDFRREMHLKTYSTMAGIVSAISNGMSRRTQGEHAVLEQKQELLESKRKLDKIKELLNRIKKDVMDSGNK